MRVLTERGALVTVRGRAPAPTHALELRGELPHWSDPIAMTAAGGGAFEARLRVEPGVYEVKLRSPDGAWHVDPRWRTIAREGEINGVLVVGGTEEPVLHAPAPPWVTRLPDGRVRLRAGLGRGAGGGLRVRTGDEADATRAMRRVGDDGDHRLFELDLPGAGRIAEYAFVLADGRVVGDAAGAALRVDVRELPAPPPAWWRDGVVYTVFVDRFRRGGCDGRWRNPARSDRETRAGGDLDGVVEALPYLADLGVTVLHLTPVATAPSPHRYDAIDPRAVDPELGGDAAFDRLVAAAHARGLRVIVDVAVTHVDRDFAPFRDVRARGPASPYWRWFRGHRWPFFDGADPGYEHYQKGQWREPLLDLDEPEVREYLAGTFAHWARRGADGLRVDAAADVPLPLVARLREAVRAVRRDAVVFGEVVPACVDRFVPGALDAATDFAMREALVDWLRGAAPAAQVAAVAARQRRRGAAGPLALGFTGTHDQPRIATLTDPARARLALLAVCLGARVPLLYYGDEIGLRSVGAGDATRAFEDSWPDRQPMPWDEATWDHETRARVRSALALRRELGDADEEVIALDDDTLAIRRGPIELQLCRADATHRIIDRRAPRDVDLEVHNGAIAREAFVRGHVVTPAYPARLYVTVTEACNLRCRHCITDAPARTQGGTARTLAPWLLDALEPAFAHADYIAFTHGGESLAAPIFPEVLRRIGRARGGRRCDVHLITNGTLLDEERLRALVDLGATSLMVSLDGATAATNDRIRVLGRFDRVVANVAAATRLRAQHGWDLRIGLSTVVGKSNVAELAALGRLSVDLGVDWLKVEETYPATPFARHDLLDPGSDAIAAAMAALRDAVTDRVVLVDHLAPPSACVCEDPAAAAFRAADDFANRATFRPCRAAWEQAAVDPDGTVRAVDYAGAPLGNLLDAPLLDLWNAPPALRVRERTLAGTPESRRRLCTTVVS